MANFAATDDSSAIFISYTHVDNQPFGPDALRWISYLHEQLTSRLEQLLGQRVTVWRDDKLHGNDVFAETTAEQLSRVRRSSRCARPAISSRSGASGS